MYTDEQKALAEELAQTLRDWHSITQYLKYTKVYSENQLRDALRRVMAMPQEKIKKTRGALFTYLIQQYDSLGEYPRHEPGHEINRDSDSY